MNWIFDVAFWACIILTLSVVITKYILFAINLKSKSTEFCDPRSIDRLKSYAFSIHIPVLLWIVMGCCIAFSIFNLGIKPSIMIGLFLGLIIYTIERVIIIVPIGKWSTIFRVLLGILIAVLGAGGFDEVLFHKDINRATAEYATVFCKNDNHLLYEKYKNTSNDAEEANKKYNDELDNRKSKLSNGYGINAKKKEEIKIKYDHEVLVAKSEYDTKIKRCEDNIINNAGLLGNLERLLEIMQRNVVMSAAWLLLFSFMLLLECSVLIAKWAFKNGTRDDKILEARLAVLEKNTQVNRDSIIRALELKHSSS